MTDIKVNRYTYIRNGIHLSVLSVNRVLVAQIKSPSRVHSRKLFVKRRTWLSDATTWQSARPLTIAYPCLMHPGTLEFTYYHSFLVEAPNNKVEIEEANQTHTTHWSWDNRVVMRMMCLEVQKYSVQFWTDNFRPHLPIFFHHLWAGIFLWIARRLDHNFFTWAKGGGWFK